jgi:RNA polymerase sigma-70 factor, ECF subfamily
MSDSVTPTLGSLLDAGPARSRVAETEWVQLVRAIASEDQAALATLYERTHRLVFTLILRIVANRASAEELTLDVFHDIWQRAAGYDEQGGTVVGWIMNQARSRALDRIRFDGRKKRVNPHPAFSSVSEAPAGGEELIWQKQRGRHLRQAMTRLTHDERAAIELAFFADCTYVEVASRLDEPPGTIKTRIRSGMAKLRLALDKSEAFP